MQRSLQMSVSLKTSLRQVIQAVLAELQGEVIATLSLWDLLSKDYFWDKSFSLLHQDDVSVFMTEFLRQRR